MSGLSSSLLKKLTESLLDCGPFGSDRMLMSVFVDDRIAPWKNQVSAADTRRERVDLFVSDFLKRKNSAGQSVLVLFLQAVFDRAEVEDQCSQRLNDIAIEVAAALNTEVPPLARNNLWRAAAVRSGEALPTNLGGYALPLAESDANPQLAPLPPNLPARSLRSVWNRSRTKTVPIGSQLAFWKKAYRPPARWDEWSTRAAKLAQRF